jgi:multidrug efflux pump subunit AcrA (membrane-fusion protein)
MTRLVPTPLVHVTKVLSFLFALGLGLFLSACAKKATPAVESEPSTEASGEQARLKGTRVEVAVIQPSRGGLTMRVPGEVEGARDAHLGAPMGGYIESVAVKEGQKVKQGAVLARVDSRTYSTRRVRAQVERDAAGRELNRTESLGDSIQASDIDDAQDRVANADAALSELLLADTR